MIYTKSQTKTKTPLCTSESLITGNFPTLWSAIYQPQLGTCNLRTLEMDWRQKIKVGFSYIVNFKQTWTVWDAISQQRKLNFFLCRVHLSCVSLTCMALVGKPEMMSSKKQFCFLLQYITFVPVGLQGHHLWSEGVRYWATMTSKIF